MKSKRLAEAERRYKGLVPVSVCGILCLAGIETYNIVAPFKGSAHLCDSDMDYYGYSEIEYEILDRKGYKATWLADKITEKTDQEIKNAISQWMSK